MSRSPNLALLALGNLRYGVDSDQQCYLLRSLAITSLKEKDKDTIHGWPVAVLPRGNCTRTRDDKNGSTMGPGIEADGD
ncbi:hypothetical protein NL676_008180 [Syzygium grande]|nr:hypothetical protein NL676_008180 [Syzygium grande]